MADHHRPTSCQTLRPRIGAVIVLLCGLLNTPPGAFADLRVAVQGPADRGLRQAQFLGQLFQVHCHSKRFQFFFICEEIFAVGQAMTHIAIPSAAKGLQLILGFKDIYR